MEPYDFKLQTCIDRLKDKRGVFHSEADFQFALAWEIQQVFPEAYVRLEYCPKLAPQMHVDILVSYFGQVYPIELKFKKNDFFLNVGDELYSLKKHGAQDIGKYDCLLDIMRVEQLSTLLSDFGRGYVVWLTNDSLYWKSSKKNNTICRDFSMHEGCIKSGKMNWAANAGLGTTRNREQEICLHGNYQIHWQDYSSFVHTKNGDFRYCVLEVSK